ISWCRNPGNMDIANQRKLRQIARSSVTRLLNKVRCFDISTASAERRKCKLKAESLSVELTSLQKEILSSIENVQEIETEATEAEKYMDDLFEVKGLLYELDQQQALSLQTNHPCIFPLRLLQFQYMDDL